MNSCEACGGSRLAPIRILKIYTKGQPIHVCEACGLVQVVERRPSEEIWRDWDGLKPADDEYRASYAAVAARHAYVAGMMSLMGELGVVCDVGAADGAFSRMLFHLAKPLAVNNYTGMAEEMSGRYDTITLNWTLENCASARDVVIACVRALKPGGRLVIATGSRILVPFKKPLWAYIGDAPTDMHPWRFTANTLGRLVWESTGIAVETVNRYRDSDYLVMAFRNEPGPSYGPGDGYARVIDYFERWHRETQGYHVA